MLETISAYQISAQTFFETLQRLNIDLLLDIRLKNQSQLCGFTKKSDLAYLVPTICRADYRHDPLLAPDARLLERYLKRWIGWEEYAGQYWNTLLTNDVARQFQERYGRYHAICLLGTATQKRRSHSEVLQAYLLGKELDHAGT